MKIQLITVGKVKEKYWRDAIQEYSKRLSAYCTMESVEEKIKDTEGIRILSKISDRSYVIALAIEGKMRSSEELAKDMADLMLHGESEIVFVIGGSLGLSPKVMARADRKLSFSPMTFPHQMS